MDNQTTPTKAPVQAPAAVPAPAQAAVKVYPTSYLPAKASLELPRPKAAELQSWHIEGVHIVIFLLVLFSLFIMKWKRPNIR